MTAPSSSFDNPSGLDLVVEVSRSHSDTLHLVGLLWTSDRHIAETFTWHRTQPSKETDIYIPEGFEPAIPEGEQAHTHVLDKAAAGIGNDCPQSRINEAWTKWCKGAGLPTCPTTTKGSFKQRTVFLQEWYRRGKDTVNKETQHKWHTEWGRGRMKVKKTKSENDKEKPRGKKRSE